jgi:prophage maintenance system killer protein
LISKAAILFYLIIKNRPFANGNKPIAMTALMIFSFKNKKRLAAELQQLYDFTIWVAPSKSKDKDSVLFAAERFLQKNMEKPDTK